MDSHLESLVIITSVGADKSDKRILVGELFLTLGVTLQMLIETLDEIGRIDGRSDLSRERQKGEQGWIILEHFSHLGTSLIPGVDEGS